MKGLSCGEAIGKLAVVDEELVTVFVAGITEALYRLVPSRAF
jgi:hypothetical protein